jgi:glycosyltransferase involved in cell wall biosynthesis
MIEALALLGEAPPAAFLLGAGPMRAPLERRAAELGIAERVTFCGWCPEPGGWVAGAAVLAAPSREEAWSQAVAMAMALGTPVVAAAVEGLPDALASGRGILVPPEDPRALAGALADVLAGRRRPDLAAARRYAEAFTPEAMGRIYAARYRELVARTAAASPV